MNREAFMKQLAALLSDLSEGERREALQYYENYFDDAGAELEEQVIKELESPEKVAKIIQSGLGENNESAGEYSERGYTDSRFETNYEMMKKSEKSGEHNQKHQKEPMSGGKIVLLVLLILCALPVVFPIVIGVLGAGIGILAAIAGIFIAIVAIAISLVVAGLFVFGVGILKLFSVPPVGILSCGVGLVMTSIGILLTNVTVILCMKLIPVTIRGIVRLVKMPFQRKGKYA